MTAGSVEAGIAWIEQHFLNNVSYDHAAGAATRFGPQVPGQLFPSSSSVRIMDCSGLVIRAAVEGGMPRYHEGIPESSGSMDQWADAHPVLLLWSNRGGGKYQTLRDAVAHAPRGAVFGIGGYRNGDAGHTGYLLGPGGQTLESASGLGGCRYGSIWRFSGVHAVTHLYLMPMHYGAPAPPPPPVVPSSEVDPAMLFYQGAYHYFWIDANGDLQHKYPAGTENMSGLYGRAQNPGFGKLSAGRPVEFRVHHDNPAVIIGTTVAQSGYLVEWIFLGRWAVTPIAPHA